MSKKARLKYCEQDDQDPLKTFKNYPTLSEVSKIVIDLPTPILRHYHP